jgi:hypothetical protein
LSAEHRRLNGFPAQLPAAISRALYPADRQLTGRRGMPAATDWRARYDQLRSGDDHPGETAQLEDLETRVATDAGAAIADPRASGLHSDPASDPTAAEAP